MSQTLWIARHGNRQDFVDAEWHLTAERPFDPGLSPDGIQQAKELGRRLLGTGISYIFASPFLRTVETAHYVAETLDLPIHVETGLSEFLNPSWFLVMPEKLSLDALADRFPRVDLRYRSQVEAQFPETVEQAFSRSAETARRLADTVSGDLLLVGHGASVIGAVRGLLNTTDDMKSPLCGLFQLVRQDQEWSMTLCGDTAHLSQTESTTRYI